MFKRVKFAVTCAMAICFAGQATAAETKACLSSAEATSIFSAMLPGMIKEVKNKCAPSLGPASFIASSGDALVTKYQQAADLAWPQAKLAFGKLSGEVEMTKKMPDELLRPLMSTVVASEVVGEVKPSDCAMVEQIVRSLSPLPAENVATAFAATATLGSKGKDGFSICEGQK